MTGIISTQPCESCEFCTTDLYTGAGYCKAHPTGELDCAQYRAVDRIGGRIAQIAAIIATESDQRLRAMEAAHLADSYSDILYELDADVSTEAVFAACGVSRYCAGCDVREPADGYEFSCAWCVYSEQAA